MRLVLCVFLLAVVGRADIGSVPLDPVLTPTHLDYYCIIVGQTHECMWLIKHRHTLSSLAKKADEYWKKKQNIFMDTSFKNSTGVYIGDMDIDRLHFVLRDEASYDSSKKVVIKRRMRIEGGGNYEKELIIASTRLNVPKELPRKLDTMTLSADHTFVEPFYLRVMLAATMAVGSLGMDPNYMSHVLQIGLGAGLMNNFFHNRFPNMKITIVDYDPLFTLLAQKYFHLKLDQHQEMVHSEATEYFNCAVKQGLTFDVMFFDACDNTYREDDGVCCPVKSFLEPENVELFRRALKPSGKQSTFITFTHKSVGHVANVR